MPPDRADDRIVMVIESDYPSGDGGGAEAQVQLLARALAGLEPVTVLAPLVPYGPPAEDELVEDTPVHRLRYPRVELLGGLVMLLRLAAWLVRHRRRIRVLHCHIAHNMAALCCAFGRLAGIPVVVKLTGMREFEGGILSASRSPAVRLRRWLIRRATFVQAISADLADGLARAGFEPARIQRIPNAVDTRLFAPDPSGRAGLRARLGLEAGFVAGFVGRLVPEKALDTLLRAWAEAFPPDASAVLVLVGTGPLEAALRQQAQALGRAHQVRFAGFVADKATIADHWRCADIGLLPSAFEGLSNALLEAMAAGVPVIGSRVSGTIDLIAQDRTGWLFEPGDISQLAACLRTAAAMPAAERAALGEAARQAVLRLAGIEQVIGRLRQLYAAGQGEGAMLCVE
jgi:glycosyltransferase involved in cell wall biosynthesis